MKCQRLLGTRSLKGGVMLRLYGLVSIFLYFYLFSLDDYGCTKARMRQTNEAPTPMLGARARRTAGSGTQVEGRMDWRLDKV